MQIHLVAVGTRMPAWVAAGFHEYAKRLPASCRLVLREVPAIKRGKGANLARIAREEGLRLLAAVPNGARIVALERAGRTMDTVGVAAELANHMQNGQDLALLVGGPEGLAPEALSRAQAVWSLSALTLAHPVVRVVLAEQLYRAWSIINERPYHR
ncbi:MAG: 23S rRNA (pseudouridine(1915)-N(3))-methyltransferase RlmH [Pseudomonadota bacterium]|nr:MAG: 23S rRNA (pseudouridine(1915)-N(3))-methyltransferase RlmH [Pseudomonadota bacterium]